MKVMNGFGGRIHIHQRYFPKMKYFESKMSFSNAKLHHKGKVWPHS